MGSTHSDASELLRLCSDTAAARPSAADTCCQTEAAAAAGLVWAFIHQARARSGCPAVGCTSCAQGSTPLSSQVLGPMRHCCWRGPLLAWGGGRGAAPSQPSRLAASPSLAPAHPYYAVRRPHLRFTIQLCKHGLQRLLDGLQCTAPPAPEEHGQTAAAEVRARVRACLAGRAMRPHAPPLTSLLPVAAAPPVRRTRTAGLCLTHRASHPPATMGVAFGQVKGRSHPVVAAQRSAAAHRELGYLLRRLDCMQITLFAAIGVLQERQEVNRHGSRATHNTTWPSEAVYA